MALLKEIEINNSGVVIEYWRIARVMVDFVSNVPDGEGDIIEVLIHGYKSKEDRDIGKNYVVARTIQYTGAQLGDIEGLSRAELYEALKSDPDFENATDI